MDRQVQKSVIDFIMRRRNFCQLSLKATILLPRGSTVCKGFIWFWL